MRSEHIHQQSLSEAAIADRERALANLARLTGEGLQPQYIYTVRPAEHLAPGELMIEPILGAVRIVAAERGQGTVLFRWRDDYGPSQPAGRYPLEQSFLVRTPGPDDSLYIRQKIDQAAWRESNIPDQAARLIAAHLHPGPSSGLFRFAIDGAIPDDRLYDELDQLAKQRPLYKAWIGALVRHCIDRTDLGPVPGWRADDPTEASDQEHAIPQTAPPIRRTRTTTRGDCDPVLTQMLDAAFDLGVLAARSRSPAATIAVLARSRSQLIRRRIRSRQPHKTGKAV